jgi:DhnA family fructose-bisphosphate aldolase class Ia
MCWYCKKWESLSPKTYARWTYVATGNASDRDLALLRAAAEMGAEIVATQPAKTLKKMAKLMKSHGTTVFVEGLETSDGGPVTEEDRTLFNWAAGHKVVEWGDLSMPVERVQ